MVSKNKLMFFLGIDVRKYLKKLSLFTNFFGREVNDISKSELFNEIGICIPESGLSRNSRESSSVIFCGISINLV